MRIAKTTFVAFMAIASSIVALMLPVSVRATAGSPQICSSGASCTIGEFLYDDEYTPITSATCTITSRYPDGTLFLNSASMTAAAESDGWYSYTFTTPTTTGYYRTQVCCTVGSDLLCVDKSFESSDSVTDTSSIASAVWSYSDRTLTSFGTLVSDIWGYSSRSITTFGDLVTQIWNQAPDSTSSTTTSTSTSNSTSTSTSNSSATNTILSFITKTGNTVEENRILLERLVNEPIIENFWEEEDIPDIESKLTETKAVANQLFVNNQYMVNRVGSLIKNWKDNSLSTNLDNVIELNQLMGEEGGSSNTNVVLGAVSWINNSWDWQEIESIDKQAKQAKNLLVSVQTDLGAGNLATKAPSELTNLFNILGNMEVLIGSSTDATFDKTLYGKIQQTQELAEILNTNQQHVDSMLAGWETTRLDSSARLKVDEINKKIIAINKVPQGSIILDSYDQSESNDKNLKNSLLASRALIVTNKQVLAKGTSNLLLSSWFEEGSLVIKTVVINPSKLIAQDAEVNYFLPPEIREQDVLSIDDPLSVKYNTEEDQYFVEGTVRLAINETKIFKIKLEDIWEITREEVDSLRSQSDTLANKLDGTSYFTDAVVLKSDIYAALDKIISLQESAITPEQQIRKYREALIQKLIVDDKLDKLSDLLALAASDKNMYGFVGGVSAISVWGIIVVVVAGFVFLAVFMKKLINDKDKKKSKKKDKDDKLQKKAANKGLAELLKSDTKQNSKPGKKSNLMNVTKKVMPYFIFGAVIAGLSGITVAQVIISSVKRNSSSSAIQNKDQGKAVNSDIDIQAKHLQVSFPEVLGESTDSTFTKLAFKSQELILPSSNEMGENREVTIHVKYLNVYIDSVASYSFDEKLRVTPNQVSGL